MKLTKEERAAISALKSLEKNWPTTLWVFATGNALHVMKCDSSGKKITNRHGGFDQEAIVDSIHIPNDGGDF